ncbi:hypothetical protein E2F43_14695 [Seongchinamella unica]|uniref:Porin n=1 Tax=Seongchinamella unica TaxID=2547392 RepID=A0A4R5LQH5_9GAMM|nr:hypothetical protein [Seongchinamella unica]TDG12808.1 hypothetical protein E2F43_14695 [Seongchinamella unica]
MIQNIEQCGSTHKARPPTPGVARIMKRATPWLAPLVFLPGPAGAQSMTLEELQAELQAMQEKMQEMQAMQEKMQQMEQELELLRAKDARRDAGSERAASDEAPRTMARGLPSEDARTVLLNKPVEPLGRGEEFIDPEFEKSAPLFGSDYRFSIGGYAKTDLIFDFDGVGDKSQFVLSQIPVNDSPQSGSYSHLQIKESRTHLEIRNMASPHEADKFFLEFDFFENDGSTNFRLRHAYFQYGRLLAGRTWSIITELRALPYMLDFAAGDALLGGRSEQIKWDGQRINGFDWAIGLESYDDTRILTPDTLDGRGLARSRVPRLSGGVSYPWDSGVISIGGAVNEIRFEGNDSFDDESELGWTAVVGLRAYIDALNQNYIGFNAGYTKGTLQDILVFANGGTPNATIDEEGELDVADGWNANIGLHYNLPGKFSANLHYAYTRLEHIPELFQPDETIQASSVHSNLIYEFDKRFRVGVEYMWGDREIVSGDDGDASRLQFSTVYYY